MRKVLFALCEHIFQYYDGLDTADKPGKLTISSSSSINSSTNVITKTYSFQFKLESSGLEVEDE
jgi:hypothetical protein